MATATAQIHGADGAGITSLQINITASQAGSVIVVGTYTGATNSHVNANLPTDSGSQTYVSTVAQASLDVAAATALRVDHILSTASGITSVTLHSASSCEITGKVHELTGTNNTVRSSPAAVTNSSTTSLATNSISATAGDIIAAFVTDGGGTNTQYGASAGYTIDSGYTPNGTNQRGGSAKADNVAGGSMACTFSNIGGGSAAPAIVAQVAYQSSGGGAAAAVNPPMRTLRGAGI